MNMHQEITIALSVFAVFFVILALLAKSISGARWLAYACWALVAGWLWICLGMFLKVPTNLLNLIGWITTAVMLTLLARALYCWYNDRYRAPKREIEARAGVFD